MSNNEGVHIGHCCVNHGCKYGYKDCPVELGTALQGYPCPSCRGIAEIDEEVAALLKEREHSIALKERLQCNDWKSEFYDY